MTLELPSDLQVTTGGGGGATAWARRICSRKCQPVAFFFFGTLMDGDVLERVLDRPLAKDELAPARLDGFRRVRAAQGAYPTLVEESSGTVEGVVLRRVLARDVVRIRHFEEDEFDDRWLVVRLADGAAIEARVFFAVDHLGHTDEPWDLGAWRREHKPAYLELCREWMRDCPA